MEDTLRVESGVLEYGSITRLNPCFNGRYSQSWGNLCPTSPYTVLILVLMEDTLRALCALASSLLSTVLILVLMEDTLRVILPPRVGGKIVLILVLMEDTLRVFSEFCS